MRILLTLLCLAPSTTGAHPAATARKQPYVEVALVVGNARNGRTRRTAAWRGAERAKRNPTWRGERFIMGPLSFKGCGALTEPGALSSRQCTLKLQLLDGDRFASDTFMGQCEIPLCVLDERADVTAWYPLERRKRGRANGVVHGRLQVRLRGMPVGVSERGAPKTPAASARVSAEADSAADMWAAEAPIALSGAVRARGTRRARGGATTPRSATNSNAESKERRSASARRRGEDAKEGEAAAPKVRDLLFL